MIWVEQFVTIRNDGKWWIGETDSMGHVVRYLHPSGIWHNSMCSQPGLYDGYFETKDQAEKLLKSLGYEYSRGKGYCK